MRVLVAGGAGYVGSHTCKALASAEHEVVTYDNLSTGHRDFVKWGAFVHGDIRDTSSLVQAMKGFAVDAVMHFAAAAYVGESVSNPGKYYRINVDGTRSILDAMQECSIKKLVFSSSCATYGIPATLPISEAQLQNPINPYGRTKLICEQMIADYAPTFGLQAVVLRYFNAAGADPELEIGERHDPETHLIPLAIAAAMGTGAPLQVFGNDYDTPDGTCLRDYIHVSDLAEAHVKALNSCERLAGEAINLGTGSGTSVREIASAVERVAGHPLPIVFKDKRIGDPPVLVAATTKAHDVLGWSALRSTTDQIIGDAWRWAGKEG